MESDDQLASRLANEAGRLLMELRSGFEGWARTSQRRGPASHEHIVSELRAHRAGDAIVSEEDDPADRPWPRPPRHWVIDPLDGTREYSERRSDFAVHVALVDGRHRARSAQSRCLRRISCSRPVTLPTLEPVPADPSFGCS